MVLLRSRQDKKGKVKVAFCPTTKMLADFFTKPLQSHIFKRMRSIILNIPDTDKISIKHRSVIMGEQKKNQDAALMNKQTPKTRAAKIMGNKTKRKNRQKTTRMNEK